MRLVSMSGARLRRAAEEEERERERERPVPPPPPVVSHQQFNSLKNKFFDELTHLPSEHSTQPSLLLYSVHSGTHKYKKALMF